MVANIHTDMPDAVLLAEQYAAALGLSLSTVSLYAAQQGQLIERLRTGAGITVRRHARIVQWFSDHWPAGLAWPSDVSRPPPSRSPLALDARGEVADRAALAASLGVDRDLVDKTVSQYGRGGPRADRAPRQGSAMREIADLLALAGDARFARHAADMAASGDARFAPRREAAA